jgi:hypothetical protein
VVKRRLLSWSKVFNSFDPSNQHNRLLEVVTIATGLSKLHNGAQKNFQCSSCQWLERLKIAAMSLITSLGSDGSQFQGLVQINK